jgi:hypothetical protein
MYLKKKMRKKLIIFLVIVLAVVFWRGIRITTALTHDCEFKLVYAVCEPKNSRAVMPGVWDILKAGVKF